MTASPLVMLMSSNGAGMGHLTRLLAYAVRLPPPVRRYVLAMSQAVPVVSQYGYRYEYLPSAGAVGMANSSWQPLFQERLEEIVGRVGPDLVVFDGTHPYAGMDVVRAAHPGTRWVWSRRGMWKPGRSADQLAKASWFDEVIEPGDLAAPYDEGAAASALAYRVGPVTLADPGDLLPREEARARLGLPAQGRIGLISLGAGNINDTSGDVGAAAAALRHTGCGVAVTQVDIAREAVGGDVHAVRAYPLAPCYSAFDVVFAAAGYNSFHELLRLGIPTAFVPNRDTALDDQDARSRYAADQGWAVRLDHVSVDAASAAIWTLLEHGSDMAAAAVGADPGNGAAEAAGRLVAVMGA
ncbi:MAG: glycosyltransferase [Tetrasphaera sp.]